MSDIDYKTVELDHETGLFCSMCLFTNVTNTIEIREKLITGKLQCCIANVAPIFDPFQVVVAANRAALNSTRNRMVTRNINTEILFNMSLSDSIVCALNQFGLSDDAKTILVVLVHKRGEEKAILEKISEDIKGENISVSHLKNYTDESLVKKTYIITGGLLQNRDLLDAIVSKISGSKISTLPSSRNRYRGGQHKQKSWQYADTE
ncbi:TP53RK-binding protein [Trachymyrmex zeteki]|uniref:TP53RK-binding protein n=2 Tax=Mycetomoellerius zeteki TaxID=64791 RepID=A0A151X848_9HYME|nr:PREDICTED: EKC/KEOPS complex subunit TPRKB-like isoform X2 [Trachymyrmex zeteki]XP_018301978.1 PREDICTED: EKC/KEOPS complex subunit TPRKB-like isoform X2 [Trachymyrmex zeteki]XP_018301979.1 PREDICTED: EKC/KEOPS complex subunit TPRKB-like isoform X2 [Trachymyrmex zeteki]XP_018301980.1 PREDICTED: EKC/KEOPS complex subunit TPRKB-like isoform X2 [Trachymyrmex zeteki]KYQ56542.1 TP53RK-binding protein [Trachymyrmex zeteki]